MGTVSNYGKLSKSVTGWNSCKKQGKHHLDSGADRRFIRERGELSKNGLFWNVLTE